MGTSDKTRYARRRGSISRLNGSPSVRPLALLPPWGSPPEYHPYAAARRDNSCATTARTLCRLLLSALLAMSAVAREAPAAVWTSIGPDGASVTAVSFNPSDTNRLLLGTGIGGVFASSDGGATWSPTALTSGNVRGVAVDPQNSARAYAAT